MTKKILILTLSLLTINLVSKAQVELISSGTGSAYTLTVPGVFSLRNGIQVTFKAHANSSAAATINVSGSGALSIMKDGGTNALSASDIKAGQIVTLVFDGSNWQMMNPVATPPAAPTTYWSPNGSDIYNNNGGNVTVNADNSDGAYKMAIGKNASSVEKVLALTNTNNFVGGGTTFGFRSNFGGTLWDQALISGITGALSASGDLAFSVMQNRGTSTMIEAMRIKGNTGRIGIMTPNPDRTLHVLGDGLKIENAGTNLEIYPNGNEFMISTTKQYLSFAGNGGATAMYMDNGNIFVNLPLTIQDGSQASGRVLASDASGNATWTDLSAISSGSTAWTRSAGNIYPTTISDKVGIGNTSPTTSLQIHSTSGSGNLRLTSASTGTTASDGFSISNDGSTNLFMSQHENADWYFATNGGTTAMTIKPTGNVGIGTTNPSLFKLHVESSTNRRSGYFYNTLNATNIVNNEIMGIYAGAMGTGASDKIGGFFETSGGTGVNYGVYGQAMGGVTNWAGYFGSGNVYITNNLGIGAAIPDGKLHIAETKAVYDGSDGTYAFIQNSDATANNGQIAGIKFRSDGVSSGANSRYKGGIAFQKTGSWGVGDLLFLTNSVGSNASITAADERMRITSTGNVGIGTTSPSTSRLNVVIPSTDATNGIGLTVTNNYTGASAKYGIDVNVDGAGSGVKYGISSSIVGLAGDASTIYGYQVNMTPNGTGTSYGIYSYNQAAGTGTRYGFYNLVYAAAANVSTIYGVRNVISNAGTGNSYGIYNTGEDYNYFSGSVGIGTNAPTQKLTVSNGTTTGTYTTTGWIHSSDARLKTNIENINNSLEKVMQLNGVYFNWKNNSDSNRQIGFIAQEVEKIIPEVVVKDINGDYGMAYGNLSALLINAIKEQQKMIEELKKEVEALKNK